MPQEQCQKQCPNKCKTKCKKEVFDFVVVGLGNTGATIANRLTESGLASVCVLEAGRDDARLQPTLPEPSFANVPQPGDFQWNTYLRALTLYNVFESRGFAQEWFFLKESSDPKSRSISYPRMFGWGGCSSHNVSIAIRNAPYNWNSWGIPEWQFSQVAPFYFKTENRSQLTATSVKYYDPTVSYPPSTSGDPNNPHTNVSGANTLGGFSSTYYGYSGNVPLLYTIAGYNRVAQQPTPGARIFQAVNQMVTNVLNTNTNPHNNGQVFNYPLNVDIDYPPTAWQGGTYLNNVTQLDQTGFIAEPGAAVGVTEPAATYNLLRYGDTGYVYPPELAPFGFVGLAPTERANSVFNYIYTVLNRTNLKIKSEVLATKLITKKCKKGSSGPLKIKGVKYLSGWNLYQTGRNVSAEKAGYGGSSGDAKANALLAQKKGTKSVYARKEVILCAGVFNTAQLLMLSGIGDSSDLAALGIKPKIHLPVGKTLLDNQEIFPIFRSTGGSSVSSTYLSVMGLPTDPYVSFELNYNNVTNGAQNLEGADVTIQRSWTGLKQLSALNNTFARNTPNNIIIDPVAAGNPYPPAVFNPARFIPIYVAGTNRMQMTIEQEENNFSTGFMKLVSKDPTAQPLIVANYFTNAADQALWNNVWMNNVFPSWLGLGSTTAATATSTMKITNLVVTSGGTGYISVPTVTVTDTATSTVLPTANFTAVISGGAVVSVTVIPISGLIGPFTVVFGGPGTGAMATVSGSVDGLILGAPGSGYSTNPFVTFSTQPQASVPVTAATASVTMGGALNMAAGFVSAVNLLTGGAGYSQAPIVTIGTFFAGLIDPAPYEILKDGNTSFTDLNQIDPVKFNNWLSNHIGGHHMGASCKMGNAGDPTAVTDPNGAVLQTKGLRCCDMSIVPVSIRWPNGTMYVIGEKIAAFIRSVYGV